MPPRRPLRLSRRWSRQCPGRPDRRRAVLRGPPGRVGAEPPSRPGASTGASPGRAGRRRVGVGGGQGPGRVPPHRSCPGRRPPRQRPVDRRHGAALPAAAGRSRRRVPPGTRRGASDGYVGIVNRDLHEVLPGPRYPSPGRGASVSGCAGAGARRARARLVGAELSPSSVTEVETADPAGSRDGVDARFGRNAADRRSLVTLGSRGAAAWTSSP